MAAGATPWLLRGCRRYGRRRTRAPPKPRGDDCPLGAWHCLGTLAEPGPCQALPPAARTPSAGAAPGGLQGAFRGIWTAWPAGAWDGFESRPLEAPSLPPLIGLRARAGPRAMAARAPCSWGRRRRGRDSSAKTYVGPGGSRSSLGARRGPSAACVLEPARGFPPRRPPKQRWSECPRQSGKATAGRPAPWPAWAHSWPAGCLRAWLLGLCASGRLVLRAGRLGADCLHAVRPDADAGVLDVRTLGRPPARTSGSLTPGRASVAPCLAPALPVVPPAPALPGLAPLSPCPWRFPIFRLGPRGGRLVTPPPL